LHGLAKRHDVSRNLARLWNAETGQPLQSCSGRFAAFSQDGGGYLAIAGALAGD